MHDDVFVPFLASSYLSYVIQKPEILELLDLLIKKLFHLFLINIDLLDVRRFYQLVL